VSYTVESVESDIDDVTEAVRHLIVEAKTSEERMYLGEVLSNLKACVMYLAEAKSCRE
jgi:hypothetical protein